MLLVNLIGLVSDSSHWPAMEFSSMRPSLYGLFLLFALFILATLYFIFKHKYWRTAVLCTLIMWIDVAARMLYIPALRNHFQINERYLLQASMLFQVLLTVIAILKLIQFKQLSSTQVGYPGSQHI
jgi:hypothetical protein